MKPPASVRITGWGAHAPERRLTNADLELLVDTSDEWIVSRTGIRERRIAAPHETTASLGAIAAKRALATAGLVPDDIDLIIVATLSPDYLMPSTASLVKEAIGNRRAAAFDVAAACSGLVFAYATADAYVRSGMYRNVLIIGAEVLTRFIDFTDRGTCILFGDGAGALILSASDEPDGGTAGIELTTDPEGAYMLWVPSGGSRSPASAETAARGEHYMRMEGRETYKFATRTLASTALAAIEHAGWTPDQVDLFIPHHRVGRQGPWPAHGQDGRERGPLRQHVRGVRGHRARRGGRDGPREGRRSDRARGVRRRLHVGGRGPHVDRGSRARGAGQGRARHRSGAAAGRLELGRPDAATAARDPRGEGGARGPARRRGSR
jgi:3-oxoacyl-[acyl-carrier-protein] synthase-3